MVDVVYSSDDLTVYSGPSSINVNVGIGSKGTRGSRIYSLTSDPRTLTYDQFPGDVQEYDFGIVINGSSGTAIQTFQKVGTGINDWVELEPISVNIYSTKSQFAFTVPEIAPGVDSPFGVTIIPVPISLIFSLDVAEYTTDLFSVQYEIEDTRESATNYPVSSSMSLSIVNATIPSISSEELPYLYITISAIEYDPNTSSWVAVNGLRTVHGIVTVVA